MSTLQTAGSPAKEQSGAIILSLSACADYGPRTHPYAEIVTGGASRARLITSMAPNCLPRARRVLA